MLIPDLFMLQLIQRLRLLGIAGHCVASMLFLSLHAGILKCHAESCQVCTVNSGVWPGTQKPSNSLLLNRNTFFSVFCLLINGSSYESYCIVSVETWCAAAIGSYFLCLLKLKQNTRRHAQRTQHEHCPLTVRSELAGFSSADFLIAGRCGI